MTDYRKYVARNGARHEIYTTPSGALRIIQNPRPRYGRAYFSEITREEADKFQAWDEFKAQRDAKNAKPTGTCQICERRIGTKAGVIAHHGYQRPHLGSGWQTQSCDGARHLPFEQDRKILGDHIEWLELTLKARTLRHAVVSADGFAEKLICRKSKRLGDTFEVARGDELWDTLRHDLLCTLRQDMDLLPKEIERQQKRYDGWKPKG